jgi:hypothetical protein
MKQKRYTATDAGDLVDNKTKSTIRVASFAVIRSGRHPVVKITDRDGKKYAIARYTIDETAYSYGTEAKKDGDIPPAPEAKQRKHRTTRSMAVVRSAEILPGAPDSRVNADGIAGLDLLRAQCYSRVDAIIDQLRPLFVR